MRKINPMMIAAAAAGVGIFAMSRKKKGSKKETCDSLYRDPGHGGYKIGERTMMDIVDRASELMATGATDVDTIAAEALSMIEPNCDWGVVATGGGDDKAIAVFTAAQDIVFTLMNPPASK